MKNNLLIFSLFCIILASATATVAAVDNSTGNRIWDAGQLQGLQYTWTPLEYSGFYYDLDSGEGSESLIIKLDNYQDRSIEKGDLVYSTKPIETGFAHDEWESFQIIGFMADRYFAGYSGKTDFSKELSLIDNGQITKVLVNEDEERSLYSGSSLILKEGYVLDVKEIDLEGNKVFLSLKKNDKEVDSAIVASNDDYVYKKKVGSTNDLPVIAVHLSNIFRGTETNAVFIQGIFQISDKYTSLESGDKFGQMKIDSIDATEISMINDASISLDKGKNIKIMGKLRFIVADEEVLRFAPYVDMTVPGTYELRGTIAENEVYKWTPLNFEGFYYNIDEDIGAESLEVKKLDGRTVQAGNLVYSTSVQQVGFEHAAWGKFNVVGFLAEKYFAGYPANAFTKEVSIISNGQLSKVLVDSDEKRSVYADSSLVLEEGYVLELTEVDINGDKILVTLKKNGKEVDNTVVTSNSDYVYKKKLGSSNDIPVIVVHFNEIFRGREMNAVFVQGIFQISDSYTAIKNGEQYGKMEITSISDSGIVLKNKNSVSLARDKTVSITGDISFKVADSTVVRYYPLTTESTLLAESLSINAPTATKTSEHVIITVSSRGAMVENAHIMINGIDVGVTAQNGTFEYIPLTTGTIEIIAEKEGYVSDSQILEVVSSKEASNKIAIEVSPEKPIVGEEVTIHVLKAIGGEPVGEVELFYDGNLIGNSSEDGTLRYTVIDEGIHKITTGPSQYNEAELVFEVKAAQASFKYFNLAIDPLLTEKGKPVTINIDVMNDGTGAGKQDIELLINGKIADTKSVLLQPGEQSTVSYLMADSKAGTYSVQIGDQTDSYVVKGTTIPFIGIFAVVLIMGLVAFFTTKGFTKKRQNK